MARTGASKKRLVGTVQAPGPVKVFVSEPTCPEAKVLSREKFLALCREQEAYCGAEGAPFRHFAAGDVGGRAQRQWKSIEVAVPMSLAGDACYWCEFLQGGESVVATKELPDGRLAIYAEYQCW